VSWYRSLEKQQMQQSQNNLLFRLKQYIGCWKFCVKLNYHPPWRLKKLVMSCDCEFDKLPYKCEPKTYTKNHILFKWSAPPGRLMLINSHSNAIETWWTTLPYHSPPTPPLPKTESISNINENIRVKITKSLYWNMSNSKTTSISRLANCKLLSSFQTQNTISHLLTYVQS